MCLWHADPPDAVFRDAVLEERAEKQVADIIQKTLEQRGSFDRKFFYAISR